MSKDGEKAHGESEHLTSALPSPPSAPPGGTHRSAVDLDTDADADCGSDVGEQVFR